MPTTETANGNSKALLVIGGGIAGLTAALDAAETGLDVILIEKSPYLGGRVAGFHNYFPKLCPPSCGLEINFRRLRNNPRITVLTLAELEKLEGSPGQYDAVIKIAPRYVSSACTLCGDCFDVCHSEIADPLEFGFSKTKAVHARRLAAFPATYVLDRAACATDCHACVDACKYGAIDLAQGTERKTFRVGSVIVATGWKPYDAAKLDNLGYGKSANVVTNVMLERLAAMDGPTGGKLLRPSDGKAPKSVAFVQCAGSRDENHLPYCSTVCCLASLKQTTYVRKLYPEAKVTIFYIDVRTPGQLQEFASKVRSGGTGQGKGGQGRRGRADQRSASHGGRCARRQEDDADVRAGSAGHRDGSPDCRIARGFQAGRVRLRDEWLTRTFCRRLRQTAG